MKTIPSIFAMAAVSLAGTAMAQVAPSSANNGASDVFVAVFATGGTSPSGVFDLQTALSGGPNAADATPAGPFPVFSPTANFTIQLDGTAAAYTAALGTGQATPANLFGVFAGNIIPTSGISTGEQFWVTGGPTNPVFQNQAILNGNAATAGYVDTNMTTVGGYSLIEPATNGKNWSVGSNPGTNFGVSGYVPTGTVGTSSLNFYETVTSSDISNASASATKLAGTWALSSTGLLTYTVASSSTPLPAAVWMLLSGLLGFGSIARRRGSVGGAVAA